MIRFDSARDFHARLVDLPVPDQGARAAASKRQGQLTKPPGSLGRLEELAIFLAGWQGRERPMIEHGRAVVFAGNHGVVARGVSAFPADVTVQMVANFRAGGAAINALAKAANLTLDVVPLDLDRPTADFTQAPAMGEAECLAALNAGAASVMDADLLVLGEMGIGNTTAAAALAAASFGARAADWVGPGTGVDAQGIARKVETVEAGLVLHREHLDAPFEILRRLGGREIVAIAGALLASRLGRVPVVLDGFIATSAITPLTLLNPAIGDHCIAGHCSAEPGHIRLLDRLGLEPLLALDMRLGEGSGAAVAVQIIRAALAAHNGMATFAEAGVAGG
ncbi:nicotinate-nucleotide--dimethylbenzimidazole phosphoribosyltransferase [Stakelama sp. CBK3Z-3]|uniref:Nicotinate-nucleotide--dimethylbenzimidazole phosphoribosyltransferase n=1 Tax=Stakelama flava TaxID=2860338 RepID=A0ABS6XJ13_9SPHN|nr:nicotinate-nucleotide--dimethylbenzimidazole phosphoribosyltransferase [Stakelama flava]MBW4330209.1 nicotinate-nucleotide--dimethylbenzimidazole phosphoribosyltransferase [Stakelama flava]